MHPLTKELIKRIDKRFGSDSSAYGLSDSLQRGMGGEFADHVSGNDQEDGKYIDWKRSTDELIVRKTYHRDVRRRIRIICDDSPNWYVGSARWGLFSPSYASIRTRVCYELARYAKKQGRDIVWEGCGTPEGPSGNYRGQKIGPHDPRSLSFIDAFFDMAARVWSNIISYIDQSLSIAHNNSSGGTHVSSYQQKKRGDYAIFFSDRGDGGFPSNDGLISSQYTYVTLDHSSSQGLFYSFDTYLGISASDHHSPSYVFLDHFC